MLLEKLRKRFKRSYPIKTRKSGIMKKFIRYSVAVVGLLIIGIGIYLYWYSVAQLSIEQKTYIVEPGTSLKGFARMLHREKVLPDAHMLVWIAAVRGQSRELKAGEYQFRKGMTAMEILEQVTAGRVVEYPLKIVEGWNFKQVLEALHAAPRLTHTLKGMSPKQIMAMLGYPNEHPEGRFFPDTYYYPAGMSDLLILQRAHQKLEKILNEEWENRSSNLPYKSRDEALIMASIVEKETGKPEDRDRIAGVFVRRLAQGMKLQTDPTVIYGLGDKFNGNLTIAHLRTPTPYNTYTMKGLPPTPIAMPGKNAIRAALKPDSSRNLYFVSRGDGTSEFSETLEQHNNAVVKYQLKGRPLPSNATSATGQPKP